MWQPIHVEPWCWATLSSFLCLSHGSLPPGMIPCEQTAPSNRLPYCAAQLHSGQGKSWGRGMGFSKKNTDSSSLDWNWLISGYEGWSKEKIRIKRKSLTQGWFPLKQSKHSNFQKLFKIKLTKIWAKVGREKVFQAFNNGFSMILQGVHCPISTIMHSNRDYSSKPKKHCSFVICTFCPWSHGFRLTANTGCDMIFPLGSPPNGSC